MKKWLHKVEYVVDRIIPYSLIVLVVLIVLELFFHEKIKNYLLIIEILDYIIIAIFMVDLYFKYERVRNFKTFLKKYWLDVIAVFPFFLVFRMFEEILVISGAVKETFITGQRIVHSGVEVEKIGAEFIEAASKESKVLTGIEEEGLKLVREAEQAGKLSRTELFAKVFNPISRVTRTAKFASKETEKNLDKEIMRDEKFVKKEGQGKKGDKNPKKNR